MAKLQREWAETAAEASAKESRAPAPAPAIDPWYHDRGGKGILRIRKGGRDMVSKVFPLALHWY
jgi:hypothetical protein